MEVTDVQWTRRQRQTFQQTVGPSPHALLCQPGEQLRQWHGTALSCHFATVTEQDQAGNGADSELCRQLGIGFAVELGQAAAALQLAGGLGEGRGEAAAGPHQLAQTSTSSGRSPLIWLANWLCCSSNGWSGSASDLQRPQRGASCTRAAGMRLRLAHCAQGTINESVMARLHGGMPIMWSLAGGYQAAGALSPWMRSAPGPGRQGCRRYARCRWTAGSDPATPRRGPAPRHSAGGAWYSPDGRPGTWHRRC